MLSFNYRTFAYFLFVVFWFLFIYDFNFFVVLFNRKKNVNYLLGNWQKKWLTNQLHVIALFCYCWLLFLLLVVVAVVAVDFCGPESAFWPFFWV